MAAPNIAKDAAYNAPPILLPRTKSTQVPAIASRKPAKWLMADTASRGGHTINGFGFSILN